MENGVGTRRITIGIFAGFDFGHGANLDEGETKIQALGRGSGVAHRSFGRTK